MSEEPFAILLAEDNKANQVISKAMIEAVGATVKIAENGLEVLALLSEERFDLVLMDCQMPDMDGFEATTEIRKLNDRTLAEVPIVALTADAQGETREACLATGMDDFLTKPFTMDQIKELIAKWGTPAH